MKPLQQLSKKPRKKKIPLKVSIVLLTLLVSAIVSNSQSVTSIDTFRLNHSAFIGNYQNINFYEGGFSGMYLIPGTNGKEFYVHGDRGPNVDFKNGACTPTYDKMYPFPSYVPKIHRIRLNGDSIQILQTISIKRPSGTGVSGVLNPTGYGSTATEQAWNDTISNCANVSSLIIPKDVWGIDPEGIVIGRNNDFWLCEEGGATIWNLDYNGKVIKRYSPYANLSGAEIQDVMIDSVFKYRKNNRGFEGLAITPNGKIFALIQSPILYPTKAIGEASYVHRIVEIDPLTGVQKMYAYLNPGVLGTSPNQIKAKDWKIGDMVAINDSMFLVLEQAIAGTNIQRKIYLVNINQATPVHSGLYGGQTLEQLKDLAGLTGKGIIPVQKTLFLDLMANNYPAQYDKAEGLAIINDSTLAICNDNDFGQMSSNEDGIAIATGIKSNVFVYNLSSSNKIQGFIPANSNIPEYTSQSGVFSRQISLASDDQEEWLVADTINGETLSGVLAGQIDYNSSDLELGQETGLSDQNPQLIGLRFQNIAIHKNTPVSKAYLRFEVDATNKNANPCNLVIYAENVDSANTFNATATFTPFELTSRPKLADSIVWIVPADSFIVVNQRYNSVDISPLVQQLVNRPGWKKGNAMAFYIKGNGTREVESFEGENAAAAILNIEYLMTKEDSITARMVDSVIVIANTKIDTNYTIPSFTDFKIALVKAQSLKDNESVNGLITAMNNLQSKYAPYSIVMSLNEDPSSRMAFNWFNNAGIFGGKVQIVQGNTSNFSSPLMTINAKVDSIKNLNYCVAANGLSTTAGIANNTKKNYMSNKALATGLIPNTTYSFRVGNDSVWSEVGTFKTAKANKDAFSFVYFTDPQANTDEMFDISQKTTHAAMNNYPNANFWLSCGDLVETSGSTNSEWEYEQFFKTQQDIWMKKPFVPVTGNHDKSANKNFTSHFNTDSIAFDFAKATTPGAVYSFVYGDALFMALSYEDYSVAGYLDSLSNWMKQQVNANPTVKWRIAYYHKTMYTGSGSHQSDADGMAVRNKMAPLFDSLKIDVAFQGHDHVYEVIGPVKNKQLVQGAVSNQDTVTPHFRENVTGKSGGIFNVHDGTLYFLNNSGGKKKYEPRSQADMTAAETALGITNYFSLFNGKFGQTGRPTFSNVEVSTDTITIETYEVYDDGSTVLFDKFKIVKPMEPVAAGEITGNDTVCQKLSGITYSVAPIFRATSYQWTLPTGVSGSSTTNTITVNYTDSAISGNIKVRGLNENGAGDSSMLYIMVNPLPATVGTISGNATACQGENNVSYTIPTIANATTYNWILPNGATGTSTTNTISVNFNTSATSGNIWMKASNSCGSRDSVSYAVTVNHLPAVSGTISGNATACQGENNVSYTIPTIANATTYNWTLPNGATGTSTTNTISVNFNSSATSGNIWMKASNSCGSRDSVSYTVSVNPLPAASGTISGNATVCQGENNVSYTIPTIANATTYNWTLSNGATGTSTTNTISVNFNTSATSGNIWMKASNSCGSRDSVSYTVSVNPLPAASGTILGNTTVCQGENNVSYTIPTIANATTYNWTLSNGATGTSTTNTISVNFNTSATSGNIWMKASNSCGSRDSVSYAVSVNPLPAASGTISGNATVCQGENNVSYAIPTIANATTYNWTLPNGATGTSTTNTISVNYSNTAISGNIIVKGTNSCGNRDSSFFAVNVKQRPATPIISLLSNNDLQSSAIVGNQWFKDNQLMSGSTNQVLTPTVNATYFTVIDSNSCKSEKSNEIIILNIGMEEFSNEFSASVYPNPVQDKLFITLSGIPTAKIEIFDLNGKLLMHKNIQSSDNLNVEKLSKGCYLLRISSESNVINLRFIK